jgi:Uma2 family endonuclease
MATVPKEIERAAVVPPAVSPPVVRDSAEQRFILRAIDWATYDALGDLLMDRNIRMTYDGETLELMTPSPRHEHLKTLMARLIEVLPLEMEDLELLGLGSMTFKREDVERGLESDECYWIQSELAMRGKDEYDAMVDPPPDLALEVEVSRSVLDRLEIYAKLRIPEVWRFDGEVIHILFLRPDGQYVEGERSSALPFLPVQELVRFVGQCGTKSDSQIARDFQKWVREQVAAGWQATPNPAPRSRKKKPRRKS